MLLCSFFFVLCHSYSFSFRFCIDFIRILFECSPNVIHRACLSLHKSTTCTIEVNCKSIYKFNIICGKPLHTVSSTILGQPVRSCQCTVSLMCIIAVFWWLSLNGRFATVDSTASICAPMQRRIVLHVQRLQQCVVWQCLVPSVVAIMSGDELSWYAANCALCFKCIWPHPALFGACLCEEKRALWCL